MLLTLKGYINRLQNFWNLYIFWNILHKPWHNNVKIFFQNFEVFWKKFKEYFKE